MILNNHVTIICKHNNATFRNTFYILWLFFLLPQLPLPSTLPSILTIFRSHAAYSPVPTTTRRPYNNNHNKSNNSGVNTQSSGIGLMEGDGGKKVDNNICKI